VHALARTRTCSTPQEKTSCSAINGCCTPMVRPIAGAVHDRYRSHDPCPACERIAPLLCGHETSPSCPPRCGVWLFLTW
jgi:hypothetical protein